MQCNVIQTSPRHHDDDDDCCYGSAWRQVTPLILYAIALYFICIILIYYHYYFSGHTAEKAMIGNNTGTDTGVMYDLESRYIIIVLYDLGVIYDVIYDGISWYLYVKYSQAQGQEKGQGQGQVNVC